MKKPAPIYPQPPERADPAARDASRSPEAPPSRPSAYVRPATGTPAAAFLAALNVAYSDEQETSDLDLPRAMRPHMRRVLEQDR